MKRLIKFGVSLLSALLLSLPLGAQMVTASFDGTPLPDVIAKLKEQTGCSVISSDKIDLESYTVTASLNKTPLSEALSKIFKAPLSAELKGNVIAISLTGTGKDGQTARKLKISGFVRDENGDPLPGAGVVTDDGKTGTMTSSNGRYEITVSDRQHILKFSFLGYTTQEILISGRTTINVDLAPDMSNELNELVVIGYGTARKSDLTGSVSTVKMSDIAQAPNTSLDQALQGRLAGVDIMSTSGAPGANTSIRIRGTRSINASNEPLIIVDGVIDAVHDIGDVNPADVESISIMKDASSTAIYGSRGANGVVLITTRRGVTSRPSIVAKAEFGVSQIAKTLDVMNKDEFIRYMNDRYYFMYGPNKAPVYDPADYTNDTNWIKEITRIAPYQNYSLSASGKVTDKLSYFGSVSWNDTKGIIKASGIRKMTGRFNISYDFAKWLNVALKMSYSFQDRDLNKANIGGTAFWDGAIYLSPIIGPNDRYNPLYENGNAINTPIANINMVSNEREMITKNDVVEVTLRPVKGLTIKSQNSLMVYQRHDYQFWPSYLPNRIEGEGADGYRYEGDARKWSTENTAMYARKGRGHAFDALLGFSASANDMNYFSLKAEGLLTDELKWNNLQGVTNKENLTPYTTNEHVVKESVFARVNYNYRQKYYLTMTGRFDASSNFAANNKWGFFPSAALKWAIKKENFMKGVRWVDDLSLRVSAGRTGNDAISYYRSLDAYSIVNKAWLTDGKVATGMVPSRVANPDLSWEKTNLYNVALEASLFKGRLNVALEGYHSLTSDLLLNLQTIQTTGYTSRLTNLGKTSNTGVELTLNGRIIEKKKFGWESQLTISHNRQMVNDIGQEDYVASLMSPGNNSFMMYGYKKGYPLNSLWGFQYAGVWHNVDEFERNKFTHSYISNTTTNNATSILGYPRYVDQNHDGIMSDADLIYLGNSDPILYGGFQNTFTIGNWSIGAYLTYSLGGKLYNYAELSMSGTYSANQYRYMLDSWHPVRNPESDIPRAGTEMRMSPSSFQVHDASYIRLKNVNITYRWDLSKKSKFLRDVTFGLSGQNLFLIADYNGFDPDVSTNSGDSTLRRVDMGAYPQSRMAVFSIQVRY